MHRLSYDEKTRGLTAKTKLCYSVMAKNSTMNRHGYTPFQLVFGENLKWDSFEEVCIPMTKQKELLAHISAINDTSSRYAMAEAKTKTESLVKEKQKDNVIQKDLRSGDFVRYYRKDIESKEAWRGPGKIIAMDGASVFINQAGKIVNAHVKDVRNFRNELKYENP